jgi:outer membrane lipoprotein-sorting protein
MYRLTIAGAALSLMFVASTCAASCCCGHTGASCTPEAVDANSVEATLQRLKQKTADLKSYQAQVEYLFISHPLLESETLKKGTLYYERFGEKSKLRMNFQTLKEDDEKEQKYVEHFIFDGVWLTHIDYQIESSERRQLAEPNEPVDVFDLASKNLPVVGFTKIDDLKKQFEISLAEQEKTKAEGSIKLHLKTKPDSIHKDDYTSIDVWLDKKSTLPVKVVAVSIDGETHQIRLLKAKVNGKIGSKVFDFRVPQGFSSQVIPLEKKTNGSN